MVTVALFYESDHKYMSINFDHIFISFYYMDILGR